MRKSTLTAVVFGLVFYMAVQVQNGAAAGGRSIRGALAVAAIAAFFAWRRLPS
jgi:MYXO-CTERM domain-containing protein